MSNVTVFRFCVFWIRVSIRICRLNLQLLTRPNERIDNIKWNFQHFSNCTFWKCAPFRWCNARKKQCPIRNCYKTAKVLIAKTAVFDSSCNCENSLHESNLNILRVCFCTWKWWLLEASFNNEGAFASIEWTQWPIVRRQTPMMIYDLLLECGKCILSIEYKFKMIAFTRGSSIPIFQKNTLSMQKFVVVPMPIDMSGCTREAKKQFFCLACATKCSNECYG